MKKLHLIIILFGWFSLQSQEKVPLLKTYSFKEISNLQKINPKPVVIFVYTDWCKFCLGMKKNTFTNKQVIKTLNKKFYFIKLNAEEKKEITFFGKTFKYKSTGYKTGIHELAEQLALNNNKISYPTTSIINHKREIIAQLNTYINSKDLQFILTNILKKN